MSIWNPGIIFCRKIPTASKAPEPTGKATWTAKGLPEMSIRTTKRQIRSIRSRLETRAVVCRASVLAGRRRNLFTAFLLGA